MAIKLGKLEIGFRLLVSLAAIAIAYGWVGTQLCTLLRSRSYPSIGFLFTLAVVAIFAIPQSLGGLLAAIAAVITVYWQSSNITYSLITAGVCLGLYLLNFQDLRYDPAPEIKLSIREIVATLITIGFTVQVAILISQPPSNWWTSIVIGAIAGAITLVGKQLLYTDLPQKTIWIIFGAVTVISLVSSFTIDTIFFIPKPPDVF